MGTTTYGFDNAGRTTAITNKNASAVTLSYENYGYDNADRVTAETSAAGTTSYTYDNTNQLLSDGTKTYGYDGNGNRNTTGYQTGAANQTTRDGTYTYTYDNEGNLTQQTVGAGGETWYYTYDQRNLLTSVRKTSDGTTNQVTATYTYDVLGHRIEEDKWVYNGGLTKTRMAYDGDNVWADLTTNNGVVMRYIHGDVSQQLLARMDGNGNAGWYLQDRLGSVRNVLDRTGVLADTIAYDGYGNVLTGETNPTAGGRFLFQGENEDRDLFIFSADARVDKTTIGRWVEEDPIVFRAGDPNLYRLVRNNPTNATDPSGLAPKDQVMPRENQLVDSATAAKPLPDYMIDWIDRRLFRGYRVQGFGEATGMLPDDSKDQPGIKGAEKVLSQGCVGCLGMYLMSPDQFGGWAKAEYKPEHFSENIKGPWLTFENAKALKGLTQNEFGPLDRYIIFALIGDWKEGVKQETIEKAANENGGMLTANQKRQFFAQAHPGEGAKVTREYLTDNPGMIWDYRIYQPSIDRWVGANHGAFAAALTGHPIEFNAITTDALAKGFVDNLGAKGIDGKTTMRPNNPHTAVLYYAWIVKFDPATVIPRLPRNPFW